MTGKYCTLKQVCVPIAAAVLHGVSLLEHIHMDSGTWFVAIDSISGLFVVLRSKKNQSGLHLHMAEERMQL